MSDICTDYVVVDIPVDLYPKIEVVIDGETGELVPRTLKSTRKKRTLRMLLTPDGRALYPHNIFLHSLMTDRAMKNTNTHSLALLAYSRWLNATNRTYRSLSSEPGEGAPWLFADYLLDNLRAINPETGKTDNEEGFALSTARTYMSCIIDFYKWLHREGVLTWTKDCKPFDFVYIRTKPNQHGDDYMLSHITKNKTIEVQTTTLMRRFPKIQSTPPHKKLKPLTANHKQILEEELGASNNVKALMCKLMLKTGLRLDELVSFPDEVVRAPLVDIIKVSIGPANRVRTKYSKQREIEVSAVLMQELYEYKASDERQKVLAKAGISLDKDLNQRSLDGRREAHNRLFVSRNGEPFSANTIQTYFSGLREKIRRGDASWYYRVHDMRSTYATYWLIEESKKRDVAFDFLQGELASLLGHEQESTTRKYIDFMNSHIIMTEHSARKNKQAAESLR